MRSRASEDSSRLGISTASLALAILLLIAITYAAWAYTSWRPRRIDNLQVYGTEAFKEQVVNSLILLRTQSPQSYTVVTSYIARISQARHSGMLAYERPPTLELNDRTAFYSVTWCASAIAHDSLHSKLYNDFLKLHSGSASVPEEVWTGAEVERRCCEHQTRVLQQIRAPISEISWSGETNSRYWEVDYTNRDW
jgi:hypothetical protein